MKGFFLFYLIFVDKTFLIPVSRDRIVLLLCTWEECPNRANIVGFWRIFLKRTHLNINQYVDSLKKQKLWGWRKWPPPLVFTSLVVPVFECGSSVVPILVLPSGHKPCACVRRRSNIKQHWQVYSTSETSLLFLISQDLNWIDCTSLLFAYRLFKGRYVTGQQYLQVKMLVDFFIHPSKYYHFIFSGRSFCLSSLLENQYHKLKK